MCMTCVSLEEQQQRRSRALSELSSAPSLSSSEPTPPASSETPSEPNTPLSFLPAILLSIGLWMIIVGVIATVVSVRRVHQAGFKLAAAEALIKQDELVKQQQQQLIDNLQDSIESMQDELDAGSQSLPLGAH